MKSEVLSQGELMEGIQSILSDECLQLHADYLSNLKLQYSIFEKSTPDICKKSLKEILNIKIDRKYKDEIIKKKAEITAHEIYFSSFGEKHQSSSEILKTYHSLSSFLHMLYKKALEINHGFLFVYKYKGKIDVYVGDNYFKILSNTNQILALDLCEHAYFYDYGFNKEKYIKNSLSRLNFNRF